MLFPRSGFARVLLAAVSLVPLCIACAGCGVEPVTPPPVYPAVPTRADAAGPVVPPVLVRLVAVEGTLLERSTDADWAGICWAPCNGYVPAFGACRVVSPEHAASPPFTLPGPPGTSVALAVDEEGRVWTRDSLELRVARHLRTRRSSWHAPWRSTH
jgi:hypothetical protein